MIKRFFRNIIDRIILVFYSIRKKVTEPKAETELELEDIRNAFEDYIGLIIVEFESYDENIEDVEEDIVGKMVTRILSDNVGIYIGLSRLSGETAGTLILRPTISGKFLERIDDGMMSNWAAKYKVAFVGGASIEYMDTKNTGSVSFME